MGITPELRAKMAAGLARRKARLVEQARQNLGPGASEEAVEREVLRLAREERQVKKYREAEKLLGPRSPQGATPLPPSPQPVAPRPAAPPPRHDPEITEARQGLMGHAVFGGSVLPGATSVNLHRLPSADPLHKVHGGLGLLETIPIESFGYEYVRSRYGGGNYRAVALNSSEKEIASRTFQIAGRSMPPDEPENHAPQGRNPFEAPQPTIDPWLDRRLERLEALISQSATEQAQAPSRDDLEARFERQRGLEEQRHQNHMAEMREEAKAREAEARARSEADAKAKSDDKNMTLQFFTLLANQQEQATQRLVAAMAQKPEGDGTATLMKNMVAWMGGITGIYSTLLESVRDTMADDSEKSIAQEIGSSLKKLATPLADEVLPAIGRKIAKKLDESSEPERKALPEPKEEKKEAMAFQLPDGRVVAPQRVQIVMDRLKKELGKDPSEEQFVEALSKAQDEFEDHVRAERAKKTAAPIQSAPAEAAKTPAVEEKKWASKDVLFELRDAFRNKDDPLSFLGRALRFGLISPRARGEIAAIYRESKDGDGIDVVLGRVVKHAAQMGVEVPKDLEDTFRSDILRAPKWLSEFLFGMTFQDPAQARAALDQKAAKAAAS